MSWAEAPSVEVVMGYRFSLRIEVLDVVQRGTEQTYCDVAPILKLRVHSDTRFLFRLPRVMLSNASSMAGLIRFLMSMICLCFWNIRSAQAQALPNITFVGTIPDSVTRGFGYQLSWTAIAEAAVRCDESSEHCAGLTQVECDHLALQRQRHCIRQPAGAGDNL